MKTKNFWLISGTKKFLERPEKSDIRQKFENLKLNQLLSFDVLYSRISVVSSLLNGKEKIVLYNNFFVLLIDMIVGFLLYRYFVPSRFCVGELTTWIELLADRLSQGLDWLANNPGGLKQNQRLAMLLSKFCDHHVRIWETFALMLCQNCNIFVTGMVLVAFKLKLFTTIWSILYFS